MDFYEQKDPFGPPVSARFTNSIEDMEEASNCIAVGRYTASVFHVMRVLEVGLQALATKLGFGLNVDRNWQEILNDVNGAIKRLPRTTPAEKEFHGKCSAAAVLLQQVKDAWRNAVMHPRASYREQQAIDILSCAKALMQKLVEIV